MSIRYTTALFGLLVCFATHILHAQDLTGKWEGYLHQAPSANKQGGDRNYWQDSVWKKGGPSHFITFNLEQEGIRAKGEYYIADYQIRDLNGRFSMKGSVVNNKFVLATQDLLEENNTVKHNISWCQIQAVLTYTESGGTAILQGPMEGWVEENRCIGAWMKLKKKLPSAPKPTYTDREVFIKDEISTTSNLMTINIWDHGKEDGDIISLKVNDEWILRNYGISKEKKTVTINLKPGNNLLVVYAENMGKEPPNTAALEWPGRDKQIILRSDFGSSEAITIFRKD